jgi:hypothetical protein
MLSFKDYKSNRSTGSSRILQATAQNLSLGLLRSFFAVDNDSTAADGAMAVIDELNLKSLDVLYTYQSGIASSFLMTGVMVLGMLELDMTFQYVSASMNKGDVTAAGVHLQDNLDNLAAITTGEVISISLHRIAVRIAEGPLTLKGVYMHDEDEMTEKYSGGIAVGFKVWQELAVGQYTIKKPTAGNSGFRSASV